MRNNRIFFRFCTITIFHFTVMLASCFDKVLDVSDVDMEKTEIITS
jgi:hypothetical protein